MINVLPFKQSDSSRCGPAVIKMILGYYGIDATEDEICKLCDHTYEKGCTDEGMVRAFKDYGFHARIQNNSTLEDLENWIKYRIPVIVDFFVSGSTIEEMPDGHSGIVVDIDRESVYLLEPITAKVIKFARHDFMRCWFDWRDEDYLTDWDNMVLRQIIVAYPKQLAQ